MKPTGDLPEGTHDLPSYTSRRVSHGVIDYSIVPPASGTCIKIDGVHEFMKNGVYVSTSGSKSCDV